MSTYRIDAENAITNYASQEDAGREGEGEWFGSVAALGRLAEGWPERPPNAASKQ